MFDRPCVIVDLETTGGHIARDRITEIGLILLDGDHVERYQALVNPGQPIPPFIERMTGISDAMVADAPPFAALADEVLSRLQGRLFIAHNARFDYGFLRNEFRRLGMNWRADVLCTVKLSRRLYPEHYKHNLDSLIARHGIELAERHRAMADAEAVYRFLQSAQGERGHAALSDALALQLASSECPPGMDAELLDLLPDSPGVYVLYGDDEQALYVGRASNLRSRIVAHYAGGPRAEPRIAEPISRVAWQETLGEFGAALLELQLTRSQQPRYGKRGAPAELCSIQLEHAADEWLHPRVVRSSELDFTRTADLYGLFRSVREARRALTELALAHGLCQSVLGVEQVTSRKGEPCAGRLAGKCRGACVGREPAMQHNTRLMAALARIKVKSWPYPCAVAVEERDEVTGDSVEHVFDHWCYLGSRQGTDQALQGEPVFDLDVYKLLGAQIRKPAAGTEMRLLEGGLGIRD